MLDFGCWVTGYRLSVISCKLSVTSCRFVIPTNEESVSCYQLPGTGYQLSVVSYQLSVAGYRLFCAISSEARNLFRFSHTSCHSECSEESAFSYSLFVIMPRKGY